ncbi:hypothetical protein, partial [Klebsiella pneumoniae]
FFFLAGGVNGGLAGWKDSSIHHMIGNYLILDFILGSLIGLACNGYTYKKCIPYIAINSNNNHELHHYGPHSLT